MRKRITALLASAALFSACTAEPAEETAGTEQLQIVVTVFPEYDWVMNILGDNPGNAEVTLLLDSGVDLHSYQPAAQDVMRIAACDLFIYVGGESDAWVEDALRESANDNLIVISLLDELGDAVKEEEHVEGMQEEHHEHEEAEYDEHVWLSLRNAAVLVDRISRMLCEADPEHADLYSANAEGYTEQLKSLDHEYASALENAPYRTLLFGDRFPFRYLVDDYGLDYYAAFAGCSAEAEASFETVIFLSDKLRELDLPAVMTIEGTDHRIADTIVENAGGGRKVLTLDSMQGTTMKDVQAGTTYLKVMEKNLEVLKEALY